MRVKSLKIRKLYKTYLEMNYPIIENKALMCNETKKYKLFMQWLSRSSKYESEHKLEISAEGRFTAYQ